MADLLYTSDLRPLYFVKKWKLTLAPNSGTTYISHDLGVMPLLYGMVSPNRDMTGAVPISTPFTIDKTMTGSFKGIFHYVRGAKDFIAISIDPSGYSPTLYFELFAAIPASASTERADVLNTQSSFTFSSSAPTAQILREGTSLVGLNLKKEFGFIPLVFSWAKRQISRNGTSYDVYDPTWASTYLVDGVLQDGGNGSYGYYVQLLNIEIPS